MSIFKCWETVDWASGRCSTMSPHMHESLREQEADNLDAGRVAQRLGERGQFHVGRPEPLPVEMAVPLRPFAVEQHFSSTGTSLMSSS